MCSIFTYAIVIPDSTIDIWEDMDEYLYDSPN